MPRRTPAGLVEPLVLMMAPLAPHMAEELWPRLGHAGSLAYGRSRWPTRRCWSTTRSTYPVQVNGKVRGRVEVAPDADDATIRSAALTAVAAALEGREPKKVIVVAGRMVSVVV